MNTRTIQLIGEANMEKITATKVAIFGLGGVGGTCLEVLLRSGVGTFYIQDGDVVNISNLNRQVLFTREHINQKKAGIAANFAKSVNENVIIYSNDSKLKVGDDLSFLKDYDYVIDCIDDFEAKSYLLKFCIANDIEAISSVGMGRKLDPTKIKMVPLRRTTMDPLARKLRKRWKREDVDTTKIICAFSDEIPQELCNNVISSMIFVPSSAGLNIGYYIIKKIIEN